MSLKTISVEHKVPFDKGHESECVYVAADDRGGEYTLCPYLVLRDRHHGYKVPIERKVPKCTLFNQWLETERHYKKCYECLERVMVDENAD